MEEGGGLLLHSDPPTITTTKFFDVFLLINGYVDKGWVNEIKSERRRGLQ